MMKVIGTAAAVALYGSMCSGLGRMLDVDLVVVPLVAASLRFVGIGL